MSDLVDVASTQLLKQFPGILFAPADSVSNASKHSCKSLAEGILHNLSQKLGTELYLKVIYSVFSSLDSTDFVSNAFLGYH